MNAQYYAALKTKILTLSGVKYVALWNEQFNNEKNNIEFNYPAVFIEFTNIDAKQLLKNVQLVDFTVRLHLGFKTLKTDDATVLTLKQQLYKLVEFFVFSQTEFPETYCTKLIRSGETQNFDHDQIQEYILDFRATMKDFSAQDAPTEATVTTLDIAVSPQISNHIINTGTLD